MSTARFETLASWNIDMWRELTWFLTLHDIARLYLTGDPDVLRALSNGGVEDGFLRFYAHPTHLGWVGLLKVIGPNLKRFVYDAGTISAQLYHYPCKTDLRMLGPSLEKLFLHSDGGENAFWTDTSTTESSPDQLQYNAASDPLDVGELWPRLNTLDVSQYGYEHVRVLGPVLKTLPPTLTKLSLRSTSLSEEEISWFPTGLIYLALRSSSISARGITLLPRSLETLICASFEVPSWNSSLTSIEEDPDNFLGNLPPSLTALKSSAASRAGTTAMLRCLPSSLTKLRLGACLKETLFHELQTLLPGLKKLYLGKDSGFKPDSHHSSSYLKYIAVINCGFESFKWDKTTSKFVQIERLERSRFDKRPW